MKLLPQPVVMTIATIVCASLMIVLLLFPGVIFWLFQLEPSASAQIISRRAAMLFAGFAVLSWLSRDLPPSDASRAIFLALGTAMSGLAALGCFEFIAGNVGPGIALAIAAEVAFAIHFISFAKKHKTTQI